MNYKSLLYDIQVKSNKHYKITSVLTEGEHYYKLINNEYVEIDQSEIYTGSNYISADRNKQFTLIGSDKPIFIYIYEPTQINESELAIKIPSDRILYPIDLNTREINGPEVISIQDEHYAETIYFLVDRFYDNMDLAQTNCVIQYVVNDEEAYVYAVPFCDISTYDGKIIIPWSVSLSATHNAGTIRYIVRFYLISENSIFNKEGVYDPSGAEFSYSLSTLPAFGIVRSSLELEDVQFTTEDKNLQLPERYFEFVNLLNRMVDNSTIYWTEASSTDSDQDSDTDSQLFNQIQNMPYIGENGHWWIGSVDTGITSTNNYNNLDNLPTINGIPIKGDMTNKLNLKITDISDLLE